MKNGTTSSSRRRAVSAAALVAATLVLAATQTTPAFAWGSKDAVRGCGTNHISSAGSGSGGWASTEKVSGTCKGTLWAGLNKTNYGVTWSAGNSSSAYYSTSRVNDHTGRHRGCNDCDVTFT